MTEMLTVDDNKEVNPQNCKTFANLVVRVAELSLHDGSIDLDEHDASEPGKNHSDLCKLRLLVVVRRTTHTFDGPIDL